MHETSFVHCDLKKVVVDLSILSSLFVQIKNAQLLGINICNWTVVLGDVCVYPRYTHTPTIIVSCHLQ